MSLPYRTILRRGGKNPKRVMREEVQRRLHGCGIASPGTPKVEDWGVVRWRLVVEDDPRRYIDREVEVLIMEGAAAYSLIINREKVSFQGGLYYIEDAKVSEMTRHFGGNTTFDGGPDGFELTLKGIGR